MTKISQINFNENYRSSTSASKREKCAEALLSFERAQEGMGVQLEHSLTTPKAEEIEATEKATQTRFPQDSNDQYAKQFANYTDAQCLTYITQNASLNQRNNPNVKDLELGSKRALCAIIAKAKSLGVKVTINTAVRSWEVQNRWYNNPRFKGRATSPDNSRHVKKDAFDLSFSKASAYEQLGVYAETVLKMRYGGHCKKHAERWHFDYGNDKVDLFNP